MTEDEFGALLKRIGFDIQKDQWKETFRLVGAAVHDSERRLSEEHERCAKIAEEWDSYKWIRTGPHRDEGYIDFAGSMKELAAEIRREPE